MRVWSVLSMGKIKKIIGNLRFYGVAFTGVVIVLLLSLVVVPLVFAEEDPVIENPDSSPEIISIALFSNVSETGDLLIIVEQDIPYVLVPTQSPTKAFYVGLLAEGDEEEGEADSLIRKNSIKFYNHSMSAIYLDATTPVTSSSSTEYLMTVNVALDLFATSSAANSIKKPVETIDWKTVDESADPPETVQGLIKIRIIEILRELENSLGGTYVSASGRATTDGASIVTRAIPKIRSLVPDLFATRIIGPTPPSSTFTRAGETSYIGNQGERLSGALEGIGTLVTGSPGAGTEVGIFLYFIMIFTVMGLVLSVVKDATAATVGAGLPMLLVGVIIGIIPMGLAFGIFAAIIVLFGVVFILGRMG